MEEEVQVQQKTKNQQQEMQRVTTKDSKKVEAGKRLAAHNHKKRELKAQKSKVNQYYDIGVVLAVGVIGGLGYYIYQTKKAQQPSHSQPNNPPQQPRPQTNRFEME